MCTLIPYLSYINLKTTSSTSLSFSKKLQAMKSFSYLYQDAVKNVTRTLDELRSLDMPRSLGSKSMFVAQNKDHIFLHKAKSSRRPARSYRVTRRNYMGYKNLNTSKEELFAEESSMRLRRRESIRQIPRRGLRGARVAHARVAMLPDRLFYSIVNSTAFMHTSSRVSAKTYDLSS